MTDYVWFATHLLFNDKIMSKALTESQIKDKIKEIYEDKIDIDNFHYNGMYVPTMFKCNICGNEWEDKPINVLNKRGCMYCKCENFIGSSIAIFGNKFDYSKCHKTYKGEKKNVTLICKEHNYEFSIAPYFHLHNKYGGCKLCSNEAISKSKTKSTETFIKKTEDKFGDNFTFEKTVYEGQSKKVIVTCKKHGDITIIPKFFLRSMYGCAKCASDNRIINGNEIINRFREIHGDKYKYGDYNGIEKTMNIYCSIHGLFQQTPHNHLAGEGCSECSHNYKLENLIQKQLSLNNIKFEKQKKFEWSKRLSYDFYITKSNILIECQGIQHFKPIIFFGGEEALLSQQQRDKKKLELSKEHNIQLIYYCDKNFADFYKGTDAVFFTNEDELIKFIKEQENIR